VETAIFQALNSLTLISILFLVSIGLTITFGLLGIINLAHGEFFMLGAYTVVVGAELGVPLIVILIATPFVVGAFGAAVEQTVIKHLYTRPLDTLLATWGLSLVIRQVVLIVFGARQRGSDALFSGTVSVLGVDYPAYRLFIMVMAVVVAVAFLLWVYRSDFGVKLRAVIFNRDMAGAIGVNTRWVDRMTFAVGAAIAGLAGAIIAPLGTVNPNMGLPWLIDSFLVVIVGGQAAIGAMVGAGFIGGAESTLAFSMQPVLASVLVLVIAIVALRLRPQGLAGSGNAR
jgi:branched-chain amino acid transport system permease protein/urea transport system permease protein